MLSIKPYTTDEALVNVTDNYEQSFALAECDSAALSRLLLEILVQRDPRKTPPPPQIVTTCIRDALCW
jgi:hypothetical protein